MTFGRTGLQECLAKSRSARYVAYDGTRRNRMSVVPLPFNKGVIDQQI